MTKEQFKSVVKLLNRLRAKEQITDDEYVDILFPLVEPQTKIEYYPWYVQHPLDYTSVCKKEEEQ